MKDGQYYYARLRDAYAVYQHHDHGNGCSSGDKIKDSLSLYQAREMVYDLNGWDKTRLK